MSNSKDGLNIYEVNSLLFQIISYMPEAERRELQSILSNKESETENQKDLSFLISNISEAERRTLLEKLLNWCHSNHLELREHCRKAFSIPVEHSINGVSFVYFIQNISNGGVFIQTDSNFHIGQQIILIFSPTKAEKDITVSGKVVRVDFQGIGVKFDEFLDPKAIDESPASES